MKILNVLAIAAATTALVSFQIASNSKHEGDDVQYRLDTEHSVLKWKGGKNENYFHTGTVMFKNGKVKMEHNMIEEGNFEVDFSTIKVTDENLPEDKKGMLAGHLQNEDFFNVAQYATASVKVGEYKDGKLHTTVTLLGVAVSHDVPVTLKADGKTATINGKFDFDFTSAKIPGTIPQEGDTEHISPVFSFDLNLALKAFEK